MARTPVKFFGVNSDAYEYDQSITEWTSGNNISFHDKSVSSKAFGYAEVMVDTGADLIAPYYLIPWTTINAAYWVVGCNQRVFRTSTVGEYNNINKLFSSDPAVDPLHVGAGSTTVYINQEGHGASTGDWIKISGYTMSISGLVETEVNDGHQITVTDVNNYTITVTTAATATVAGFGGASGTLKIEDAYADGGTSWNGGVLSGILILNNGSDNPQRMTDLDAELQDLDNWPAATTCKVIKPFKNFLVALNITESGTDYPYKVKWSHPADPGNVPSTWDIADSAKDAGEVDLSQTPGFVIDCLPFRDINIIYKEDAIWSMTYIGGQSIFAFKKLFGDVGILSQHCCIEFAERHFVVGRDDVFVHDGVQKTSIITNKMKNWLFDQIEPDNYERTFVVANHEKTEVWICFPGAGQTFCTKALVWNWIEDAWSTRDLPSISYAAYGIINTTGTVRTWNSDTEAWDIDTSTWSDRGYSPINQQLLLAGTNDVKLYNGDVTSTADGVNFNAYLERTGLTFGSDDVKHITQVWPILTGSGAVELRIGTEDVPGGGVTYNNYTINIGSDYKVDTRVSGRYLTFRFESNNDQPWSLLGFDVDIEYDGER